MAAIAEAVAVEAFAEDKVDSVPSHEDGEEGGNRANGEAVSAPPAAEPAVEKNVVGHEGDEGPCFLGIPVPETTPGVVGPNAAEDDSDRQKKDPDLEAAIEMHKPSVVDGG